MPNELRDKAEEIFGRFTIETTTPEAEIVVANLFPRLYERALTPTQFVELAKTLFSISFSTDEMTRALETFRKSRLLRYHRRPGKMTDERLYEIRY